MKTTLEIPDDLYRRTKATAALRGESLKDFVTEDRLQKLFATLIRESFVLVVDEATAETYSRVRDELRLARQHQQPVVSRDDHFDYVSDLHRVAW